MSGAEVRSFFTNDAHHALLVFIGKPDHSIQREVKQRLWDPHRLGEDDSYVESFPYPPEE